MQLTFYKYQGTGNDFIMIDNRQLLFPKNDTKLIEFLCHRRLGIGADGLILLENDKISDFRMVYYNSDGNESTMCGNGGRCIVAFAHFLGIIKNQTSFMAIDGLHLAAVENNIVSLQMIDVNKVSLGLSHVFLNTGSPHHVEIVEDLDRYPVKEKGAEIRYSSLYDEKGSNVNFVEPFSENTFKVRTYERGVEDETLSCGTGVTAVAIAMHNIGETKDTSIHLKTLGGDLQVSFEVDQHHYSNIFLKGPAIQVFEGAIQINIQ
ncbi:MAG: diaminopimelate epimerase [Flavobacterium sp.]